MLYGGNDFVEMCIRCVRRVRLILGPGDVTITTPLTHPPTVFNRFEKEARYE